MGRPTKYRKTSKYQNKYPTNLGEENSLTSINLIFCRPIEITIFADEIEALKLRNVNNLPQAEVAKKMKVSQPTIARILKKAYKKITCAILEQKKIRIKNMRSDEPQNIEIGPKKVIAIERTKK